MIRVIFDSNAFITSCKCHYEKSPAINHILKICEVVIPGAVKTEVVGAGRMYADALFAKSLIDKGKIKVEELLQSPNDILMHYKLGDGEREAIMLTLRRKGNINFLVTDDRLAFVVSDRLKLSKILCCGIG